MGNSFFKFKEFTVHQGQSAMKVCTDACLFGAWVTTKAPLTNFKNILDIGTGTGLLSLMIAQHSTAKIDGVEIDELAAKQAEENFASSPWKDQLRVYTSSIIDFVESHEKTYDLIISNPPFFENQLKSNDEQRNLAMHSANLTLTELADCIVKLLKDEGSAAILLPWNRSAEWKKIAQHYGLFITYETAVKQTKDHAYFRTMILMKKSATSPIFNEINIKEQLQYSKEFTELLAPFYLAL